MACSKHENMQCAPGAEGFPPGAHPSVFQERMAESSGIRHFVPDRFQIQKGLMVGNRFNSDLCEDRHLLWRVLYCCRPRHCYMFLLSVPNCHRVPDAQGTAAHKVVKT